MEKAVQKYQEVEAKNAEEMAAEFQEIQQSAQVVGGKVAEALTPLAQKLKKEAEAQAPAVIEAAADQSRANAKLFTGFLKAVRTVADEVANEMGK